MASPTVNNTPKGITKKNTLSGIEAVNHPPHYTQGGIECIEAIKAAMTPEEFSGYCKAVAIKYIWREKHKGGAEDIKKAIWYLTRLVAEYEV